MGDTIIMADTLMLQPPTLGKDIMDTIESLENMCIEAVYIPKELMPTGEHSSAHVARRLQEAKMLQLYGLNILSERGRIEKRYEEIKQEVRCELIADLTSILKAKITQEKITQESEKWQ